MLSCNDAFLHFLTVVSVCVALNYIFSNCLDLSLGFVVDFGCVGCGFPCLWDSFILWFLHGVFC